MLENLRTPCYVVSREKIRKNLEVLQYVEKEAGCHILLAQKAFSMFALYPMIAEYVSGTTASGLYEARLGYEEMGKENHVFAPAYKTEDMCELVKICDHIIFNSFAQYEKHKALCGDVMFKAKQTLRKQQTKTSKKIQQQKELDRRQKEEDQRKQEEEEERRKREEEIRKIRDLSNQEEQYNRFMKLVGGKRRSRSM